MCHYFIQVYCYIIFNKRFNWKLYGGVESLCPYKTLLKPSEYLHGKTHLLGDNTTCLPSSMNFHTKIVLKGALRSKRM